MKRKVFVLLLLVSWGVGLLPMDSARKQFLCDDVICVIFEFLTTTKDAYLNMRTFGKCVDLYLKRACKTEPLFFDFAKYSDKVSEFDKKGYGFGVRLRDGDLKSIEKLHGLKNLVEVNLRWTILTDKEVLKLPMSVRVICLSGCKNITPEGFIALFERLKNLVEVNPFDTNVTDDGLSKLPVSVKALDLRYCDNITGSGLSHLVNLEEVDLSWTGLTDDGLSKLPVSVRRINLSICRGIEEGSGLSPLVNLVEVNLGHTKVTDDGLSKLPVSVRVINLSGCKNITPKGFIVLFGRPNNLVEVNLRNTNVTDDGLSKLPMSVRVINLSGCENITGPKLSHLVNLVRVDLFDTNVKEEFVAQLKKRGVEVIGRR